MEVKIIHDRKETYEFLKKRNSYDFIYQINNISINQWENVVCYGLFDKDEIKEIAMLNINYGIPVLLAAAFDNSRCSIELIKRIKRFLPVEFYTHIDKVTLDEVFSGDSILELEEYMNMGLSNYETLDKNSENKAVQLEFKDVNVIKELIEESYPEAWLDDELIKLNENFGIYDKNKLVSFAGIHAYSEENQVAAVAHVTTHPNYRNKGYAGKVVEALIKSLNSKIKYIGLNVKVDNTHAIKCYKKLGFKECEKFVGCTVKINLHEN